MFEIRNRNFDKFITIAEVIIETQSNEEFATPIIEASTFFLEMMNSAKENDLEVVYITEEEASFLSGFIEE